MADFSKPTKVIAEVCGVIIAITVTVAVVTIVILLAAAAVNSIVETI